MLREALRVALTVIMKNYVYTFDGKVRKRSKGVPIGLKLMGVLAQILDRKSTRLNSSHANISYAVFCLKKKKKKK